MCAIFILFGKNRLPMQWLSDTHMNISHFSKYFCIPLIICILFVVANFCRPLLPVDETRYMTVAWEMFLRHGWLQPLTVNFEPYHHKPPLLFWLINLSWTVFGVSRWAGLIPIMLGSSACIYLTAFLGKRLFPKEHHFARTSIIMLGSFPFLVYGTLVMFDFMVTVFVLLSLIFLHYFYQEGRLRYAVFMGICLGLGVLTKGPVAYLYVLPVALLAPFWSQDPRQWKYFYRGIAIAILVSVIPVLFWLIPVIRASDNNFAFWLIWNQTAGRVTGNFSESHVRPFWFYIPLMPLFCMPWIIFPRFWTGMTDIKQQVKAHEGLRFIAAWILPVFLAFSLISGKQPHYLVPLVPAIILFMAYHLQLVSNKTLSYISGFVILLFVSGQIFAGQTILKKYTLEPMATIIKTEPKRDLAFVSNYHGEVGFLGKRTEKVDDIELDNLDQWFETHPEGCAIIKFRADETEFKKYHMLFSYPYRSRYLGVFEKQK